MEAKPVSLKVERHSQTLWVLWPARPDAQEQAIYPRPDPPASSGAQEPLRGRLLPLARTPWLQVDKSQRVAPPTRRHLEPTSSNSDHGMPYQVMECLFNIFSVTVTLHVNDLLHESTRHLACDSYPCIPFWVDLVKSMCFSSIFGIHRYSWVNFWLDAVNLCYSGVLFFRLFSRAAGSTVMTF